MAEGGVLQVTVVLAEPARQQVVSLAVPAGTSAWQAVLLAGLLDGRDGLEASRLALAIYGKQVDRERVLEAGDRVEILRPLPQDPKLRRRRLAREAAGRGRRGRPGPKPR
jgi:putative ubiquitin-RnfH superfamily antitoxin RatB of RatAB toxin-antitoxin module